MPWVTRNILKKPSSSITPATSPPTKKYGTAPVKTTYTSNTVDIPPEFLKSTPEDAKPITVKRVDFANSPIPEYSNYYATVLDNVLSSSECRQLLELAKSSSSTGDWAPAMVNVGAGYEAMITDVRSCDRIIWDEPEVVKRIWDRCIQAEGIQQELGFIHNQPSIQGPMAVERGEKWQFAKVNERMRFLRYGPGHYFKPHCDGTYETPDGVYLRSFYTLHLYLNDSIAYGGDVKGGETTFYSRALDRRLDVEPKMGRVLLFQHARLVHSGEEVTQGIKYTVRSDLMYERCDIDEE